MDSPMNEISIEDRLREVYEKTDAREYAEALDALEMARAADPGNIYVAALRRQLDALLSLSQADELTEDQRRELMEPMPGIIDCVVRDNHRLHRSDPPARETQDEVSPEPAAPPAKTSSVPEHGLETGDVSKELEALKLLYFQRASKFVMKGEYEQALAEVRRVFVVDPENTIAKEYASRVEHLLQHARRLASEPMPGVEGQQESPRTAQIEKLPRAKDTPHVHAERSTAWDADFVAPKAPAPVSERRQTPPSSRQTMAYGDSLAVSLSSNRNVESDGEHRGTGRKKSKFFLVLAAVILTPLLAGVAVAIFSTKNGPEPGLKDVASRQTQNPVSTTTVEATIGAAQNHLPEAAPSKTEEQHQAPAVVPAKVSPPPLEEKPIAAALAPQKAEAPAQKSPVETPKHEPIALSSPAPENVPPPQPKAPVAEPEKASVPAFVAVEKDPQIVKLEKPEFPNFVWKMGGEGQVVVRVLIDANGKPLDSQILKSTNPVFEQPVVDAVMKSQFNPAQMGQGPVAAWLTIPFKFRQPR